MTEHPMTEATPLASEQITRLIRAIINRYHTTRMAGGDVILHILNSDTVQRAIAALSASPAPSGQGVSGEVDRLMHVIDRDRYVVAHCLGAIERQIRSREWLTDGRGPYEWDDDRYQEEFADAIEAIRDELKPLAIVAWDKSDCTRIAERVDAARLAARELLAKPVGPREMIAADLFGDPRDAEIADLRAALAAPAPSCAPGEVERAEVLWKRACVGREGYCSSDLQDAAIEAIKQAFREAEAAARSATLPANYQWSEGNREKFDFGRDSAADAIAALSLDAKGARAGNDKAWELSWRIDRIREDGGPLTASDKAFLVETVNWMRALPAALSPQGLDAKEGGE